MNDLGKNLPNDGKYVIKEFSNTFWGVKVYIDILKEIYISSREGKCFYYVFLQLR